MLKTRANDVDNRQNYVILFMEETILYLIDYIIL